MDSIQRAALIVGIVFCVPTDRIAAREVCIDTYLPSKHGCFLDHLDVRSAGDRNFVLLKPFKYRDPSGKTWIVPEKTEVNGASIPRYLWSFGSPWTGPYRRASVLHDYFYTRPRYGSEKIHRLFYDAMLAGGTPPVQAKVMYYAVVRFNPRWKEFEQAYTCDELNEKYRGKIVGMATYGNIACEPQFKGGDGEAYAGYVKKIRKIAVEFDEAEFSNVKSIIEQDKIPLGKIIKDADVQFHRNAKPTDEIEDAMPDKEASRHRSR